jgi:hypothetical protein
MKPPECRQCVNCIHPQRQGNAIGRQCNPTARIKGTPTRQELRVSPETATSRIVPNDKPTTPRAENKKTCHPFRRVRSGSLKNSVSSLLIVITGKSCAKLAQKHQIAPRFLAAYPVLPFSPLYSLTASWCRFCFDRVITLGVGLCFPKRA